MNLIYKYYIIYKQERMDIMCKNPLVSLIIPVYNVESYLHKALHSVENQTMKDIEVIIVNDGSTDGSLDIINKFAQKNNNFTVVTQENQGLSSARNKGLSLSHGNYIAFMDSDDYIEPNFIECLYSAAVKNDADIACCNFNFYFPQKDMKIYMPLTSIPGTFSNTKALKKLILDFGVHYFAWNKLCKRDLFFKNNIKFYDMYFEDIATSPRLFYHANKIVLLGKALYNYTNRKNSILNTMNINKIKDFVRSLGVIRNFFENQGDYKKYKRRIWVYSQRVKLVTYYFILQMHACAGNMEGFLDNITSATKSIDFFAGDKFVPSDKEIPELPYDIFEPVKNIKIKKGKNKIRK